MFLDFCIHQIQPAVGRLGAYFGVTTTKHETRLPTFRAILRKPTVRTKCPKFQAKSHFRCCFLRLPLVVGTAYRLRTLPGRGIGAANPANRTPEAKS